MANEYRLYLLGAFRLEQDGARIQLYSRKVESLLAYLALFPQEHSREKLAALLWGDSTDEQARGSLRLALNNLRKQLGSDSILSDRETVQMNPAFPLWTDARELKDEFRRMKDERLSLSDSSFILHPLSFDLLPDFYDDWLESPREELRALFLDAALKLIDHARAQSEYKTAVELAQKVLSVDKANEAAHQHLMFCYSALGDRAAALDQYEFCKRALQEEFGIEPSQETRALYEAIRKQTETKSVAARLTNLPRPTTSFVGREREIEEIRELLVGGRSEEGRARVSPRSSLLTLIGPGGSGKTRLAIECGAQLVSEFLDGVWWVDLAPLQDKALVAGQTLKALGVQEQPNQDAAETLVEFLRAKQLVLILDNCEHVIDACAQLANQFITTAPQIALVATSREALNVSGERRYAVSALRFPTARDARAAFADLLGFESVKLFVDRTTKNQAHFHLTELNVRQVVRICQQLEGIPLAIELAAAQIKFLSLEEIHARLEQRLEIADVQRGHSRQKTLRAAIDWSYQLLNVAEQQLFRRIAVFVGGWTLEQAVRIAGGYPETRAFAIAPTPAQALTPLAVTAEMVVQSILDNLADKSLLQTHHTKYGTRYSVLETIREFALTELEASPEVAEVHLQHSFYFCRLAERAYPALRRGQAQREWLERLALENDNLRAALTWTRAQGQLKQFLTLAASLAPFWETRGFLHEGQTWLRSALALTADIHDLEIEKQRAQAYVGVGILALFLGDDHQADADFEMAVTLYEKSNDAAGIGLALDLRSTIARNQRALDRAQELNALSRAHFADAQDEWGLALTLDSLGNIYHLRGDYARASELLMQSAAELGRIGDKRAQTWSLKYLGRIAFHQNDLAAALCYCEQALQLAHELGDEWSVASFYENMGEILQAQHDAARARSLYASSWEIYRRLGDSRYPLIMLGKLAALSWREGETERALTLIAALEALRPIYHIPASAAEETELAPVLSEAPETLANQTLLDARQRGQAMTLEQAFAFALA